MVQIGYLQAKFDADVANFIRDMGRAADATEKTQKVISGAARLINGALGSLGVSMGAGAIFGKMLSESKQAEEAAKKVEAILRATGGAAGVTARQVDDLANSLSALTGIDDDAIKGGEAMLLTFKNIGKDVFPAATQAMLDMSETMGQDLKASAIQLGKALNDPKEGLSALQRIGVTFSESQKDVIKSLVETGQTAKAQTLILKEIQEEMGGTAAAARDTLGGALKALDTSFGNLFQTLGDSGALELTRKAIELLIVGVDKLNEAASNKSFQNWIKEIGTEAESAFKSIVPFADVLIKVAKTIDLIASKGGLQGLLQGRMDTSKGALGLLQSLGQGKMPTAQQFKDTLEFNSFMNGKAGAETTKQLREIWSDDNFKDFRKALDKVGTASSNTAKKIKEDFKAAFDPFADFKKSKKHGWLVNSDADLFNDKGVPSNGWMNKDASDNLLFTDDTSTKLQEINDQLTEEVKKQRLITEGNKEQLFHLEAQYKLKGLHLGTDQERADAENKIVGLLKEQQSLQAQQVAGERLKQWKEQNELLAARVAGMEDEYEISKKLAEAVKDIEDPAKKQEYLNKFKDQISAEKQYREQLDLQKKTLDDIKSSTGGFISKQKDLHDAWNKGIINGKQYASTLEEIRKKQVETFQKGVKDWTNKIFDGFSRAILEGKKLKDVFKELGKELGLLAAKKLLFEPISNAISNWAGRMFNGTMFGAPGSTKGSPGVAAGGLGSLPLIGSLFGGGKNTSSAMPPVAPDFLRPLAGLPASTSGSAGGGMLGGLAGGPIANNQSGGVIESVNRIAQILQFAQTNTANGLAIKVFQTTTQQPIGGAQAADGAAKAASPWSMMSNTAGNNGDAALAFALAKSLIGSSKAGPAWKVIMPDCPCGPGDGGIGGGIPGGGLGPMMAPGVYGGAPPQSWTPDAKQQALANGTYWANGVNGMQGPTASAPTTYPAYLSAAQTAQAIQQANMKANQQTAYMYSQGLISGQQAQTAYQTRDAFQLTQAYNNYRMTPEQAYGPPIIKDFILQGSPYAGGVSDWEEEPAVSTSVTGRILNSIPAVSKPASTGNGIWNAANQTITPGAGGQSMSGYKAMAPMWDNTPLLPPSANITPVPMATDLFGPQYDPGGSVASGSPSLPSDGLKWVGNKAYDPQTGSLIMDLGNRGRAAKSAKTTAAGYGSGYSSSYRDADWMNLPRREFGGPVIANQAYLTSERGPELFVPGQSGTIYPNDRLKEIMGGGASPVINLHDYTSTASRVSSTERGADGSINITLRDAVRNQMADPGVQREIARHAGTKPRGVRRG